MTVNTAKPSVFEAGLPTLRYDFTDTPQEIYPQFREAQQAAPIALGPIGPEVLSYDLARTVLRDPRFVVPAGIHLSAHGITSGPLWDRVTRSILNMEGEEHRRLRSLVSRAFTPRATARMHDTIHTVINELIDNVIDSGRCEFVADIARPYPIPVICALLGAPREDWQQFSRWAEDIFKIVSFDCDLAAEEPVVLKAWGEFDDYIDDMVVLRRQRLTDDLLSELIRIEDGGDRLNAGELRMLAFSILVAGTDTTRSQLAASMQVLCDHPDQWALLRDRPDLAMRAVEETMRHSPSMCSTVRSVADDVEIGEYTFPAGAFILVNTYAANRDPAIYDDPDAIRHHPRRSTTHPDLRRRSALLPRRQPGAAGTGRSPQRSRQALSQSSLRGNRAVETTARPQRADQPADGVQLMTNTSEASPIAVEREVIPFRERKGDIVLWMFFLVNVIFVTYQADIEQLVIRDPDNFTYPIWPPAYMIDFLHWYFANYDPLLYERPVWYTTIVIIDQVVYGPFYIAALYAFWKGKEWIRNWSIIWASVMLATVTIILGEEIAGPFASDHLPLVFATNAGWLIVPVWVLIRMWREHPFTRPVTTKGGS